MDDRQAEREQRVTPLELFFDLVVVFAITQVTSFLSHSPTWSGLLRGLLLLGALWWAAATWGVVLTGMRRGVVTRGLLDFEIAALAGVITGGIVGAVIGLVVGQVWETRHRQNRIARQVSHG